MVQNLSHLLIVALPSPSISTLPLVHLIFFFWLYQRKLWTDKFPQKISLIVSWNNTQAVIRNNEDRGATFLWWMVTTTIFDNMIWKSFIQSNTNIMISWKKMRTLHKLLLMTKLCHIQLIFFSSYLICFTDWWWSSSLSLRIPQDKHFQPTHQSVTFLTFYDPLQFSQTTFVGRVGYSAIGFLTIWDKQDGL